MSGANMKGFSDAERTELKMLEVEITKKKTSTSSLHTIKPTEPEPYVGTRHINCWDAMDLAFDCASRFLNNFNISIFKKLNCFFCLAPGNQLTTYYRQGVLDNCRGIYKDLAKCWRAKLMTTPKADEFLKGSSLDITVPPYKTDVWIEKTTPGW